MRKNWPPWLLTVSSRWAHGDQNGHSQPWPGPWPGPWLSCDLAVTEPWWQLAMTCQSENFIVPSGQWVFTLVRQTELIYITQTLLWFSCQDFLNQFRLQYMYIRHSYSLLEHCLLFVDFVKIGPLTVQWPKILWLQISRAVKQSLHYLE